MGPYVAPTQRVQRIDPRMESYEKSMLRERLEDPGPRLTSDEPQRLAWRAARAEARRALAQRFALEQAQIRAERARQQEGLRRRHEQERRALVEARCDQRRKARAGVRARNRNGRIALSLWAFQAASDREGLQRRHATERRGLTDRLRRSEVWRLWLERQAAAGDEAAKAALRGIRYRERRNRCREDGTEGRRRLSYGR